MSVLEEVRTLLIGKAPAAFTTKQVRALMPGVPDHDVSGALYYLSTNDARVERLGHARYRGRTNVDPAEVFAGGLMEARFKIARALVELGGEAVSEPEGFATRVLLTQMGKPTTGHPAQAVLTLLASMEGDGQVTRTMKNQRRTLRITLTDKGRTDFLLADWKPPAASDAPPAEPEPDDAPDDDGENPVPVPAEVEAPQVEDQRHAFGAVPPAKMVDLPPIVQADTAEAGMVAGDIMAALALLFDQGSKEASAKGDDDMARKLGRVHDRCRSLEAEVERLRRRDRELVDLHRAARDEARGLRTQLTTALNNIDRLAAAASEVDEAAVRHFRDVDRTMREVPGFARTG